MGKTEARSRQTIPEFKSIQEEAEFWDTHDFTDFTDFSESVPITVSPNLTSVLTIRIDGDDFDQLAERAQELGIGASTLARMWIRERLRQEAHEVAD
ncbi:MAG: CopG family antitoxin [Thermomicrobiales bacterium]